MTVSKMTYMYLTRILVIIDKKPVTLASLYIIGVHCIHSIQPHYPLRSHWFWAPDNHCLPTLIPLPRDTRLINRPHKLHLAI